MQYIFSATSHHITISFNNLNAEEWTFGSNAAKKSNSFLEVCFWLANNSVGLTDIK